ncbi:hypothetical protein GYH30_038011 [Glycine max]|nr:hypothetical protein GYH30_038011 [Glycine max]
MEFWGAEVKVGESVKVDPAEFEACIHLSQAALGEAKKDKPEPVVLYMKVGEQKFVLGTLSREKIPQISLELVLEKEFELSHSSKSASVHFCGYKAYYDADNSDEDEFTDSDEDDEDVPLINAENDGKKGGHTATPHPAKKGGKTPNSEAKAKTPNSEAKAKTPKSGGLSCKTCSKSFTNESGLQQHNKAKHGGQ